MNRTNSMDFGVGPGRFQQGFLAWREQEIIPQTQNELVKNVFFNTNHIIGQVPSTAKVFVGPQINEPTSSTYPNFDIDEPMVRQARPRPVNRQTGRTRVIKVLSNEIQTLNREVSNLPDVRQYQEDELQRESLYRNFIQETDGEMVMGEAIVKWPGKRTYNINITQKASGRGRGRSTKVKRGPKPAAHPGVTTGRRGGGRGRGQQRLDWSVSLLDQTSSLVQTTKELFLGMALEEESSGGMEREISLPPSRSAQAAQVEPDRIPSEEIESIIVQSKVNPLPTSSTCSLSLFDQPPLTLRHMDGSGSPLAAVPFSTYPFETLTFPESPADSILSDLDPGALERLNPGLLIDRGFPEPPDCVNRIRTDMPDRLLVEEDNYYKSDSLDLDNDPLLSQTDKYIYEPKIIQVKPQKRPYRKRINRNYLNFQMDKKTKMLYNTIEAGSFKPNYEYNG